MQNLAIDQINHPQSAAGRLVTVGGTDTAQRRANGAFAPLLFVEAIEDRVVGHHDVGALGDAQRFERDTPRREMVDLLDDQLWIDYHSCTDHRETVWIQDSGRNQVERKGSLISLDSVAGVGATVGAND